MGNDPSLTHVCMVTENGLESVTAKEVVNRYPGIDGRAAARNFLCEFCNNFVTLVQGSTRDPFFRHSRGDTDKDCPDRSESIPGYQEFRKGMYLPRIRLSYNGNNVSFDIGISGEFNGTELEKTSITFVVNGCTVGPYLLKERLLPQGVTYLSLGNNFPRDLQIHVIEPPKNWIIRWHCQYPVIRDSGAVFDGKSHVFRVYDSNLFCGKKYIFLGENPLPAYRNIEIHQTRRVIVGDKKFYLQNFIIQTTNVNLVQNFQRKLGYRILNVPAAYTPVWPIFCWNDNKIWVDGSRLYSILYGKSTTLFRQQCGRNVVPWESSPMNSNPQYLGGYVDCSEEMLITMGRIRAFDYAYLQQGIFSQDDRLAPEIVIETIHGMSIQDGIQNELPPNKRIRMRSAYDFTVVCKRNGWRVYRDEVTEQHELTVAFGDRIEIYQGLDLVFQVEYQKSIPQRNGNTKLYRLLSMQRDRHVPIDSAVRTAAQHYIHDPIIKKWIRSQIQAGHISEKARMYLLHAARNGVTGGNI